MIFDIPLVSPLGTASIIAKSLVNISRFYFEFLANWRLWRGPSIIFGKVYVNKSGFFLRIWMMPRRID